MLKELKKALKDKTSFKRITDGSQQYQNPNRVQRSKFNLRPDQAKRLNAMGPKKHKIVRGVLDQMFQAIDEVTATSS